MNRLTREQRGVTRRQFLSASAISALGLTLAACAPGTTQEAPAVQPTVATGGEAPADASPPVAMSGSGYKEAPMLADLVAAGQLPPVDERLPENPLVLESMEGIGIYGGTMRRGFSGVSDRIGPQKLIAQGLVWYTPELLLRPNIAESWELNDDASEWTFHLRPGMKWSDGHAFDTDSFAWWYEHILLNSDVTRAISTRWVTGPEKTPMTMEFPDKHTVVFKFAHPNPLFLSNTADNATELYVPGHYLAQFHADTTEDMAALDAAVAEAGVSSWVDLFANRNTWFLNPDLPSVFSFVPKNLLSEQLFVLERNPYFWQIDPEGNQLPYMDRIHHLLYESRDVFNLRIINGEIDYQQRGVEAADFTLLKENEEGGGYRVQIGIGDNHIVITPNQTVKNPRLREFFQNRNVRIAMSLGVDRIRLNELAYDGLYTPRQYSPLEQSPQSYPKQANVYLDYDPDQANQLLDEAGYLEKDAEGFRVYPDGSGETISFIVEGTAAIGSPDEDAVQIVLQDLAKVGIKGTYKGVERSLYEEHWGANEIDVAWWGAGRSLVPIVDAAFFLGTGLDRPWAEAWGRWKTDPSHPAAEEPPADHYIWTIWNLWDQIGLEPDEGKRNDLFFQLLDVWAEELPMIGYLGQVPSPIIVKNGLRGLSPDYKYPLSNPTYHGGLVQVQTYYWDDPAAHS